MTAPAKHKYSPQLGGPAIEQGLEGYLQLRVETVVAKEAMIWRKWKNDLRWTCEEMAIGLLGLNRAKHS